MDNFVVGLIAGIILTAGIGGLGITIRNLMLRVAQLEADKAKLADAKTKRIPYEVAEDLENAMAAADVLEDEYRRGLAIIGNEKAWIAKARNYGLKNKEEK